MALSDELSMLAEVVLKRVQQIPSEHVRETLAGMLVALSLEAAELERRVPPRVRRADIERGGNVVMFAEHRVARMIAIDGQRK
jgi:hypothetical protein